MKEKLIKFHKTSNQRGITLIALVITIVILIILATVSINVVLGEGGLIQRAQEGKSLTDQAQTDEQEELTGAEEYINGILVGIEDQNPPGEKSEVAEAIENGTKYTDTTPIKDDLENTVYIPGGFHLAKDSGTKVEEGIVIEDDSGNQFVWIPTGEYNVSTTINSKGKLTNELTRRTFPSRGPKTVSGDSEIESYYYGEGDSRSCTIVDGTNSIDAFLSRAKPVSQGGKGGFYIGRYEAGTETERKSNSEPLTTPLVQANKYPYVYVTRDQAKQKAETMYSGKAEIKGTTQLISSYAWDTALNFICQTSTQGYLLARTNHRWYGNLATFRTTQTGQYKVDGVESDKYSNIYDLLGNCYEFSTEYSGDEGYPCVFRGGSNDSADWAALRSPWYVGR